MCSSLVESNQNNNQPPPSLPSIEVVIEDNNEIKLKPPSPLLRTNKFNDFREPINNDIDHHPGDESITKFFDRKDCDQDKNYELLRNGAEFESNRIHQLNNLDSKQNSLGKKYLQSFEQPPRYLQPKLVNPSFSKIPDDYLRPNIDEDENDFDDDDDQNEDHDDDVDEDSRKKNEIGTTENIFNSIKEKNYSSAQSFHLSNTDNAPVAGGFIGPMVVPIGKRVHIVRFKDYPQPQSTRVISKFDYEPNKQYGTTSVIELPSSQPTLPIVFNFKTKSSPMYAKTTHYKSAINPSMMNLFQRTIEPPHYRQHIVHRPIIQDLHEIIVPYRFFVQNVQPVQEQIHQTVPENKYHHQIPLYVPEDIEPNFKQSMAHHHATTINHLMPIYASAAAASTPSSSTTSVSSSVGHHQPHIETPPLNPYQQSVGNSGLFGHHNPYADYFHPPYRVQAASTGEMGGASNLLSPFNLPPTTAHTAALRPKSLNYMQNYNHFNHYH